MAQLKDTKVNGHLEITGVATLPTITSDGTVALRIEQNNELNTFNIGDGTGDTLYLNYRNGSFQKVIIYNGTQQTTTYGNLQAGTINGATIDSTSFNDVKIKAGDISTAGTIKTTSSNSDAAIDASSGTVKANKFNAISDARLKENFQPLNIEKSILDLPTYKFDFINGNKNQIGCKAQDLQEICPEIVDEGSDGYLSIQESKIVYLLLEEVKKLRKEIDELKGV